MDYLQNLLISFNTFISVFFLFSLNIFLVYFCLGKCLTNFLTCSFLFQHDPEQCTPGGEDGNFIMFARATSGDKRNNNKFSPCSLKAIEPVLNSKARSNKGCFTGELCLIHEM